MSGGWPIKWIADDGEHWIWHRTQPVYVYLGAEICLITTWQAPSQTASEIWHLFKHCELPLCVKYWSVSLTSYVRTPLGEDSRMLWNQIFAKKMENKLGGHIFLGAQTSMWGDSEAAFPRASEFDIPHFHVGTLVSMESLWALKGFFWAVIPK